MHPTLRNSSMVKYSGVIKKTLLKNNVLIGRNVIIITRYSDRVIAIFP